jgi:hypothetical protein
MKSILTPDGGAAMSDGIGALKATTWPNERRTARRYRLDWPTRIIVGDPDVGTFEQVAMLRDLSSTGAFAYLQAALRLGAKLFVSVKLPVEKETWMMYSAIVIRVERGISGVGVAVKFDSSRPKFAKRLDWRSFKGL